MPTIVFMGTTTKQQLAEILKSSGVKAVIAAASNHAGNHDIIIAWELAMSAWYGPVGLHKSRVGSDGRPNEATLKEIPRVKEDMERAEEDLRRFLGVA